MDANIIISTLGGTNEVARICEVSPQAVSQWREDGIPKARLMFLRAIRPDVFEKSSSGESASKEAA